MELRERVIKGLRCCRDIHKGATLEDSCNICPYQTEKGRTCYADELFYDALVLLKVQEPIEARLHLCESCAKEYPECDANADGIKFGCGVGNDNVIGCTAYVNRWKGPKPTDAQRGATPWN